MSLLDSASLFLIILTLAVVPSTSVALVIARSATLGVANGIAVAVGIVLGDLIFILLAILGMSAIAEGMGAFFVVVKCVGGAYLLWMGYSLLVSKSEATHLVDGAKPNGRLFVSFVSGFFLTLGDVKAIVFYASLLPTFVDLTSVSNADLLTLVSITVVAVGGVKIAYAIAAKKLVDVGQNEKVHLGARKLAGGLMIGAGSYLIIKT